AVVLGDSLRPPRPAEIVQLLQHADENALVNLCGLPLRDRPEFFVGLLRHLQEFRAQTGRPHWLMVGEAQHLLPATLDPARLTVLQRLEGMILVTPHAANVAPAALACVETLLVAGGDADQTFRAFGRALGIPVPKIEQDLPPDEAIVWFRRADDEPLRFKPEMASDETGDAKDLMLRRAGPSR